MSTSGRRRLAYAAAQRTVEHERQHPDHGIDRCPGCGAWRYLGQCWTPLDVCSGEASRRFVHSPSVARPQGVQVCAQGSQNHCESVAYASLGQPAGAGLNMTPGAVRQ